MISDHGPVMVTDNMGIKCVLHSCPGISGIYCDFYENIGQSHDVNHPGLVLVHRLKFCFQSIEGIQDILLMFSSRSFGAIEFTINIHPGM